MRDYWQWNDVNDISFTLENISEPGGYYMYGSSWILELVKFWVTWEHWNEIYLYFLDEFIFFRFELSDFVAALFS